MAESTTENSAQSIATDADEPQHVDTDRKSIVIAANPHSGAASGLARAIAIKNAVHSVADVNVDVVTDPAESRAEIERLQSIGELRYVIAAGGDGTAGMVAQWLDPQTPLAVYPLGTENLLAKHWRIPVDIDRFLAMLQAGKCIDCDAGVANERLFLLHATVGFDAEVVRLLHERRTGNIRHWYYFAPLLRSIRKYRYPVLRIRTELDRRTLRARWAFVFNFPSYAMGLPIVSDADGTDGLLDLCTFRGGRLLNGLMYFAGVVLRRHRSWRDTHLERTTWLRIEADEEVPYQLDGDPGGFLPLEIKILPKRFRMIVPADSIAQTA